MWFLWFYLISVGICALILMIFAGAGALRIKREIPNFKGKNKGLMDVLVSFMPYLVPFINVILIICVMLQSQKILDETILKLRNENETIIVDIDKVQDQEDV